MACTSPSTSFRRAVFLDRDGTLNRQIIREGRPFPPVNLDQFALFPDVPAACARLDAAGYTLVVATNQPDVGRGTQSKAMVEAMHAKLRDWVPQIAQIEVCYAAGLDQSGAPDRRRKPEPGMLLDAALQLDLDLGRSCWSAIAGGTSTAANAPAAAPCSSTSVMPRSCAKRRTSSCAPSARRRT